MLEINTMVEGHLFYYIKGKHMQFNETYAEVKLHCYLHAILKFVGIISATCSKLPYLCFYIDEKTFKM